MRSVLPASRFLLVLAGLGLAVVVVAAAAEYAYAYAYTYTGAGAGVLLSVLRELLPPEKEKGALGLG